MYLNFLHLARQRGGIQVWEEREWGSVPLCSGVLRCAPLCTHLLHQIATRRAPRNRKPRLSRLLGDHRADMYPRKQKPGGVNSVVAIKSSLQDAQVIMMIYAYATKTPQSLKQVKGSLSQTLTRLSDAWRLPTQQSAAWQPRSRPSPAMEALQSLRRGLCSHQHLWASSSIRF